MSCIHFWEIETATGPTSRAVCRKCGKRDELHNRLAFKRIRGMVKPVAPGADINRDSVINTADVTGIEQIIVEA